jgi:hypothetical protein
VLLGCVGAQRTASTSLSSPFLTALRERTDFLASGSGEPDAREEAAAALEALVSNASVDDRAALSRLLGSECASERELGRLALAASETTARAVCRDRRASEGAPLLLDSDDVERAFPAAPANVVGDSRREALEAKASEAARCRFEDGEPRKTFSVAAGRARLWVVWHEPVGAYGHNEEVFVFANDGSLLGSLAASDGRVRLALVGGEPGFVVSEAFPKARTGRAAEWCGVFATRHEVHRCDGRTLVFVDRFYTPFHDSD